MAYLWTRLDELLTRFLSVFLFFVSNCSFIHSMNGEPLYSDLLHQLFGPWLTGNMGVFTYSLLSCELVIFSSVFKRTMQKRREKSVSIQLDSPVKSHPQSVPSRSGLVLHYWSTVSKN
jgi:hypothetical protein